MYRKFPVLSEEELSDESKKIAKLKKVKGNVSISAGQKQLLTIAIPKKYIYCDWQFGKDFGHYDK